MKALLLQALSGGKVSIPAGFVGILYNDSGKLVIRDPDGNDVKIGDIAFAEGAPTTPTVASLTTDLTGDNNDVIWRAKTIGAWGNGITIRYIDPEDTNAALSIVVDAAHNLTIEIYLATDGDGIITTTAAQIITALASSKAKDIVTCANKGGNNGSGVVTAMDTAALTGGIDGLVAAKGSVIRFDATKMYFPVDDCTVTTSNWKAITFDV